MTLILSQDAAAHVNSSALYGTPAVRITGNDVHFVNGADARVASTDSGAAIRIEGAGAVVINDAGAEIRASSRAGDAISGSIHADTIVNGGLIYGTVNLADGDDIYRQLVRGGDLVSLGSGDDTYQLGGETFNEPSPHVRLQPVIGGTGIDTIVLTGVIGQAVGFDTSGFERLQVGAGVSVITGFSNYQEMVLAHGGRYQFVDSVNPDVDLAIVGGARRIFPVPI